MLKTLFAGFLILAFSGTLLAQAQSSDELKKKQADIQREIDELRQSLNDTKKNKKAGLGQLNLVTKKLRLREQAIANINDQLDMIQGDISQSRSEIDRRKKELDTLKAQYTKSVVYAYKNRSNYDFLNFIFSAASFNDALKRVEYLKSYRQYRETQADAIKDRQQLLHQKISGLESSQKRKSDALQEQEKEKVVLVEERKEKDEIVSKLKAREREINKELTDKQRADKKLRDGIMAAIRREADRERAEAAKREKAEAAAAKKAAADKPASNNNTASAPVTKPVSSKPKSVFEATPEGELVTGAFEKSKGRLPWPVDKGQIKLHFGPYRIEAIKINGNNPGLTLETEEGAAVKVVYDGEVSSIFDVDGTTAVFVRHGKYFTCYSGLGAVSVSKGQQVKAGQVLGKAGSNSEGNGEIDFVLMQDTHNIDPEPWIKRR